MDRIVGTSIAQTGEAVSVVIPTYNRAEFLRAALESVLAQTWPAREIVVVDDGSTDHTAAVVAALQAAGAPLRWLPGPHENRRGVARNRGVAATTAPLIAFLDSDDRWAPARLERQVAALRRAPAAGFAFCNVQAFDEHGPSGPLFLARATPYHGPILGAMLAEPRALSSSLLVRRRAFDQVGGFADIPMNEDYELLLRLAVRYAADYVAEPLVYVRQHANRTSSTHGRLPMLDHIRMVESFLAAHPALPGRVRARAREGLANVQFKLARHYLAAGDGPAARRHLRAVLWNRPWDRRVPGAWLRSYTRSNSISR
jgi:glycosyltransferase involved in cell wall biosynthesis